MKNQYLLKIITLGIVIALLGIIQPTASVQAQNKKETMTYEICLEEYTLQRNQNTDYLHLDNFGHLFIPGKPDLPSKIISLAIPQQATVKSISIIAQETEFLEGTFQIKPCQIPQTISNHENMNDTTEFYNNYDQVYTSDDPYPSEIGKFVRTSKYRKYNLVDIRINPFTYYPLSQTLQFHKNIAIQITYEQSTKTDYVDQDFLINTENFAQEIIANYEQSQQWYKSTRQTKNGLHDFVIITLDTLTSSIDSIVNWETAKGRNTTVVTTSWIESNYNGYDLAEQIRNFLRDKYLSSQWGIEDVLLIGDYDDIPLRRCHQDLGYGMPETDFYYAELSLPDNQSWDADGDHQYGEDADPIDFYAEVNVGRIPFSDPSTVQSICEKTIAYEQNNDPSFKKNMLLLGAFFWADTDNAELMEEIADQEWMQDWNFTRMYEQPQSMYSSDHNLDYSTVKSNWSSNKYGFVNWAGHGSPFSCHEMYPEATSPAFVDTNTCDSLNDEYPAIIVADACSNQDTDHFNLGQAMMKQGAIGFLGATKVAFGSSGWDSAYDGSSQSLDYLFTTKVTSGQCSTGQAHQWALTEMYTHGLWYYTYYETFEWGAYLGNPNVHMFLPSLEFSFPNEVPEFIEPMTSTSILVQINEIGDEYISGSGLLHYRFDNQSFQTTPLTHVSNNYYEAVLPATSCGTTVEFYFSAESVSSGILYCPQNAPGEWYEANVGTLTEVFHDDFETDKGWTVENDENITAGEWERAVPIDDKRGDPPTDYDGSGKCYVTGNTDDEDIDGGMTSLISPLFDFDEELDAYVSYGLWYTNNFGSDPNNDLFKTYVSNDNGSSWILVETIGPTSFSGWVEKSFLIGDFIMPTDQVRLRFEASDFGSGSVVEAAIDSCTLSLFDCVSNGPLLSYDPEDLIFNVQINQTKSKMLEIFNAGDSILQYSLNESESYIDIDPVSGNSTGEHDMITVEVNATGLNPGVYTSNITMSSNGGDAVVTVEVYVSDEDYIIDINQSSFDRGFPIRHALDGDWAGAQDFAPSMGLICGVDLFVRSFGTPEFDLVVELRSDGPEGVLLDSVVFTPGEVGSSWSWLSVDFEDVTVTAGTDYFIVCPPAPGGVSSSFGYEWGYAFGDQYDDGSFWFTRDGGNLWRDLPDNYEFVFKTYGI